MTTVFVRACAGKSHSWLTPTTSRSNPSANRISVADGSSETIRMPKLYHWNSIEERFTDKFLKPANIRRGRLLGFGFEHSRLALSSNNKTADPFARILLLE